MIFTAQLGTVNSQLGQIVLLGIITLPVTPPDVQQVWVPLWLVEVATA